MSWLASIGASVLSSLLAGAFGLGIGLACVRWYNISSFEGKSGYFVGAVILLALFIGLITGLVIARMQPAGITPVFGDALLRSGAVLTGLALLIAALAWMLSPPAADDADNTTKDTYEEPSPAPVPFSTLPGADASLATWLETLRYNGAPEVRSAIFAHLQSRADLANELTTLLRGDDDGLAYAALSALAELPADTLPDVDAELGTAGHAVLDCLTRTVAITAEEDPSYEAAANCSLRWSGWMQAVATRPAESQPMRIGQLEQMIQLAATRPDSVVLTSEVNAARRLLGRWQSVPTA